MAAPASTVLLARVDGDIVGMLTLVTFPIPTGVRAWIEDVVTDESARGNGVASALIDEAIRIAKKASARTVDLSSRPSRTSRRRPLRTSWASNNAKPACTATNSPRS